MSIVGQLHDEAMNLAQLGIVARDKRDLQRAQDLARQACELETRAADLIPYDAASEPTRSILYQSAASLAYQCRDFGAALHLIAKGLSGYPPPGIAQELQELFLLVNFKMHLHARQIVPEVRTRRAKEVQE